MLLLGQHLPERAVTGEGPLFGVHVPTGLGQSRRGSTEELSPVEPCREGLGIAVGAKTAEFCSSQYSLESHSCWNTAGPEELSIQEQIPTLFLRSCEAITALLCLLSDWEAPAVFGSNQLCCFTVFTGKYLTKMRLKLKENIQNYNLSFFLIYHSFLLSCLNRFSDLQQNPH